MLSTVNMCAHHYGDPLLTFPPSVLVRVLAKQIAHRLVIVLRHGLSNLVNCCNPDIQGIFLINSDYFNSTCTEDQQQKYINVSLRRI